MHPIPGVSASGCDSPLAYKQSCTLTLSINGSQVGSGVFDGPILCEKTTQFLECYQPGRKDRLNFSSVGSIAIGDSYGGGVVACLNGGLNNLIAAKDDNSTGIVWGGRGTTTNATSTTDGAANTAAIVTCLSGPNQPGGCPGNINKATYAAGICDNYAVDANGAACTPGTAGCYDDWFLPAGNNTGTSGQLNCLYTNLVDIGGFTTSAVYSGSTENDSNNASAQFFGNGSQFPDTKNGRYRVRCVRALTP